MVRRVPTLLERVRPALDVRYERLRQRLWSASRARARLRRWIRANRFHLSNAALARHQNELRRLGWVVVYAGRELEAIDSYLDAVGFAPMLGRGMPYPYLRQN